MVSAVVLAAGMSTRMGKNKLLLNFREKPLSVRAVDTLLASDIDEVIVVLGHETEKVRDQLERSIGLANKAAPGKPVRLVQNPDYQNGLSTSVRTGVEAVSRQANGIMIYLADQPLLEPEDVNRIFAGFAAAKQVNKSIVVASFRGQRGNPGILVACFRDSF